MHSALRFRFEILRPHSRPIAFRLHACTNRHDSKEGNRDKQMFLEYFVLMQVAVTDDATSKQNHKAKTIAKRTRIGSCALDTTAFSSLLGQMKSHNQILASPYKTVVLNLQPKRKSLRRGRQQNGQPSNKFSTNTMLFSTAYRGNITIQHDVNDNNKHCRHQPHR